MWKRLKIPVIANRIVGWWIFAGKYTCKCIKINGMNRIAGEESFFRGGEATNKIIWKFIFYAWF